MNTYNLSDFSEIPAAEIALNNARELALAKLEAESKVNKVMQFIAANPSWTTRQIVEKFNLDWALRKEFENGLGRIGFYTDESHRFVCFEIHDSVKAWFR